MAAVPALSFVDPYPWYRHMRRADPVHFMPHIRSWLLFRYADVVAALKEPRLSSCITPNFFMRLPPEVRARMQDFQRTLSLWMLFRGPPDHARIRGLVTRAFTPRMIAGLAPRIEAVTGELLDAAQARGAFDVMHDLAKPLPVLVIAELLGAEVTDRYRIKQWSEDLATFFDTRSGAKDAAEQGNASFQALSEFLLEAAARRRREPKDDLLSALVAPRDGSPPLLEGEELVAMGTLLLFAGHETTTNLIGNGTLALLRHPAERARFLSDPAVEESGIEELLRYDSPVQTVWRVVPEDVELFGTTLHAGDMVFPRLGSANRDEAQYSEPDRLDLGRRDVRHVAFGHGAHFCLGAALSRLEGRIALRALLTRLPGLRFNEDALVWSEHSSLRGPTSFPVTPE
jgi:cytochrome P450